MANEFIARNGLIALENSQITGSLDITGNVTTQIVYKYYNFLTSALNV